MTATAKKFIFFFYATFAKPNFRKIYFILRKVYSDKGSIKQLHHVFACMRDNPLAKARGLSLSYFDKTEISYTLTYTVYQLKLRKTELRVVEYNKQ